MRRTVLTAFFLLALAPFAGAQPYDEGLPNPSRVDKAPADGFLGRRPLLKDLSDADQKLLASLILEYTTANNNAVVKTHENTMMDPKLHAVHQAPYTLLFSWHRTYIEGLETFLTQHGHANFVPLPKWIPSDPIPQVFGCNGKGKKLIKNFNPNQDWTQFYHSKLPAFIEEIRQGPTDTTANSLILADTLVVPHNNTHNIIGGTMSTMGSPAVPIFWCYHAFIDDIAWDWEHSPHNKSADVMKAMPGEKPPVTTIAGKVMVSGDDVMIMGEAGDFTIANEPFKSLLKPLDGKTVYVQASLDGGKATVESITGLTGQNALNVRDADGKVVGTVGSMSEVRITGEKGGRFEIDANGQKGFVIKAGTFVGADSPSDTPGMSSMLHGHD